VIHLTEEMNLLTHRKNHNKNLLTHHYKNLLIKTRTYSLITARTYSLIKTTYLLPTHQNKWTYSLLRFFALPTLTATRSPEAEVRHISMTNLLLIIQASSLFRNSHSLKMSILHPFEYSAHYYLRASLDPGRFFRSILFRDICSCPWRIHLPPRSSVTDV